MSRNPYFEHDNRADNFRQMKRPKKHQNRSGRGFPYGRGRYEDPDGDVEMNAPGGSWGMERRFNPYKPRNQKRRDKNRGKHKHPPRRSDDNSESGWFKITIPYGRKIGKQFILKSILSNSKVPFVPFNFQFEGQAAVFFVNDRNAAQSIRDVNRRVTCDDGFKMGVFMAKSAPPITIMDTDVADKLKTCMSDRYNVTTLSLNLSKFHLDPGLQENGLYLPLHKPIVLNAVIRIIKEHIPQLESLDLSDNRLCALDAFTPLVPVCVQLKSLILQNNKLHSVIELNHLKGLNILDLILDGNPLCDDFKDKVTYISAIRDRFPKLIRLDGHELPAPIGFDLGSETVPPSKGSFLEVPDDVKTLVAQFLELYYTFFDSEDREKLLEAYHDQASFSLTIVRPTKSNVGGGSLQNYLLESRNLLRITDHAHRFKLLKQGRLSVVSALSQMPHTVHDPNSFVVDIFHVSPKLMSFSVTGVFKEGGHGTTNQPVRTFQRTFVVVPAVGSGFLIANEMLCIANATSEQIKQSFKFPAPTPSPSPAPSTGDKSPNEKQQMVIEFVKMSGMNVDFSAKCLEEHDWDFQRAAIAFTTLHGLGKIPPEAFVHK